ncbi:MAG: insulinase family protein, partial [Candidatus Glassbacteria bacterium]
MSPYAKVTSALVLASCLALPGLAQKETPPAGGQPKNFVLPAQRNFTLDNGLTVTLVQFGDVPKVTVSLAVRAGNIDEAADQVWLADLTGQLMKEGTTSRSARQLAEQAAAMGGQVDISVGPDQTTVTGDVLSEFAAGLVELVADVSLNPLLPQSEIERL